MCTDGTKTNVLYTSKVLQNTALAMCTDGTPLKKRRPVHIQKPTKHDTTNVYRSEKKGPTCTHKNTEESMCIGRGHFGTQV